MDICIKLCYAEYFNYVIHSTPSFYHHNLQYSSCKHVFTSRFESRVDPDQKSST